MWAFLAIFFVLGACVGSFLNVAVLRYGFRERDSERSHCAQCNRALSAADLVPIVSFLALCGRCRSCGSALSLQYPIVELVTAVLFAGTVVFLGPFTTFPEYVLLVAYFGFWASLVALVAYDIRHTLIPLPFIYALFAFALLGALARVFIYGSTTLLGDAALGALVCGGFFALIHVVTRGRGMGLGDAYVAAAIGCMLGLSAGVVASAIGVWSGAIVGLLMLGAAYVFPRAQLLVSGRRVTLKSEIPFAPFLAVGAVAAAAAHIPPFAYGTWLLLFS